VVRAAGLAWAAAALALFVFPLGQVVLLLHAEGGSRSGAPPAADTRTRLLRLVAAWSAVVLLLLPLEVILSGSDALWRTQGMDLWDFAFKARLRVGGYLSTEETVGISLGLRQVVPVAVRIANDLSILLFVAAVGYWSARRCATTRCATAVGYTLAAIALTTVLCQDVMAVLVLRASYALAPEPDLTGLYDFDSAFDRQARIVSVIVNASMLALVLARYALAYLLAGRHLRPRTAPEPVPRERRE
jgi:hypothetical protein